jgi:hypothetical protein
VAKVRGSRAYAQNLYAALCNNEWYERDIWQMLLGRRWSCSWRYDGGVVADIENTGGDYLDWYCSGMVRSHPDDDIGKPDDTKGYVSESVITEEIQTDLARLGWYPVLDQ